MRISARADYALRAAAELAAAGGGPVKGDALATSQSIPHKFLENILADLRHARLVRSQRGADGGSWRPPPPPPRPLAAGRRRRLLARAAGRADLARRRHPRGRGPAGQRPGGGAGG